ncbi:hypothetical protein, partial [Aquitalea magnusonii]|uniref:hypothetical protein n=1 Tax=Aquitalea magnusonii TaxID=332411 RepID=UPI00195E946A
SKTAMRMVGVARKWKSFQYNARRRQAAGDEIQGPICKNPVKQGLIGVFTTVQQAAGNWLLVPGGLLTNLDRIGLQQS